MKYNGTLLKDGKSIFKGTITITETPVPSVEFPTLSGSFLVESRPDFESGLECRLRLNDGREADVFIQDIPQISDLLFMVKFYFSSNLNEGERTK